MHTPAPTVATSGQRVSQALVVHALGFHGVDGQRVAHARRAVDGQVHTQSIRPGAQRALVVHTGAAGEELVVGGHQHQVGFALALTWHQMAADTHTGQVVEQQQHAVQAAGVQGLAALQLALGHAHQARCLDALGFCTLHRCATKNGLDDLDGDDAVFDLLLGQERAHHPPGLAVGGGHPVGGIFELGQRHHPVGEGGQGLEQLLGAEQGVAHQLEAAHLHRGVAGLGHPRGATCWGLHAGAWNGWHQAALGLAQQRARVDVDLGLRGHAQRTPRDKGGDQAVNAMGWGRHGAGNRKFQPELLKIR